MATGLAARSLVAAALLAVAMPVAGSATEGRDGIYSLTVPGNPDECTAIKTRRPALRDAPCIVTLTSNVPLRRNGLVPTAAAAFANQNWWMAATGLTWKVQMNYQTAYDWGRAVKLNWRDCNVPYAIAVSISITWCSAWPDWWEPDWIDVGMNYTVSALTSGFPIRFDHGMRRTHNSKGGFGFVRSW